MQWLETLRGMDRATLSWMTLGIMAFTLFVLAAMVARYWQQKYAALREYADKVVLENDDLRNAIAQHHQVHDAEGGEIVEVTEDADKRGPGGETLH